jgi:CO/xanthine dehydrogenase FAD-binding subunit
MKVSVPAALQEALEELATHTDSVPLAGGTDLLVAINFGRARPERIISIRQLEELQDLSADGEVRCGAGVTYTRIQQELGGGAMQAAARTVGSPQIRNAGTLGGNLGTCSPAGDTLPVLAALDAEVIVRSSSGERRLPFAEFMLGPKKSALRPGELVIAAEWRDPGPGQAFLKVGTRNAMVIAVANVAMVVDRVHRRVGVALGSVGPTIIRAEEAGRFAEGLLDELGWENRTPPAESARRRFGELVAQAAKPIDDVRGSAAYRRHAVAVMAARALERTCASG